MKKVWVIFIGIIFLITLLTYSSVLVSPQTVRVSGFVSLLIPVFLVINIIMAVWLLIRSSKMAILPILALFIGYKFIFITFGFSGKSTEDGAFSVLSYNMKWLVEANKRDGFDNAANWISGDDSEIKCFQEFHSRRDIVEKIKLDNRYELVMGGRNNTLAIFAKGRILDSGILFETRNINNVLFADILIESDTIRVYNVHLESMGIDIDDVASREEIRSEYDKVKSKFLKGSVQRSEQIEKLLVHVSNCQYPIIIAGDFNDVPYSYNHFKFKRNFKNAFESAGRGFGFTFNGSLPFLRIDHQFYNEKIKVFDYKTLTETNYSDHFPIKGRYSVLE